MWYRPGVIISNSETGLGSVTIQPLIYRLVCSNGMVINDAKTRRNHVGRAATSDEDFSIYSNETLLADDHAFVLKLKDTVRAAISEARFAQAVNRMRESTTAMLDTKSSPPSSSWLPPASALRRMRATAFWSI